MRHVDLLGIRNHWHDEVSDVVIIVRTNGVVELPIDDLEGSVLQCDFNETDIKCYSVRLALRYLRYYV